MGNAPSKSGPSVNHQHPSADGDKRVNRRTSIQALSSSKAPAADPSASKDTATGYSASQRQQTPAHYRFQSRSIAEPPIREDRLERHGSRRSRGSADRERPVHTQNATSSQPSRAVQVPDNPSAHRDDSSYSKQPQNTYYTTPSHLSRPPRLPLPIGDAMTAPGSPITASGSLGATAAFDNANLEVSPGGRSELGDYPAEDDDLEYGLGSYGSGDSDKTVTTVVEWRAGGEKVYVTGTFVNWARKFKLHKR